MQKNYQGKKLWEKLFFSPTLCQKSATKKIAYIAVLTAVLTVGNTLLEIKFFDVQFSFTLLLSVLAGIILGGGSGFCACLIGDALGYIINSWGYVYMPWVGLALGITSLASGLIFHLVNFEFKGGFILKLFFFKNDLRDFNTEQEKGNKVIAGLRRISKPGLRIYAAKDELPKVLNGLGTALISTSKGIMTDKKARELGIGGEVLAYIW